MPKFVQIGFAGLTRLAATLTYLSANCVCPCTSIQNVQWEIFMGGGKYANNTLAELMVRKVRAQGFSGSVCLLNTIG